MFPMAFSNVFTPVRGFNRTIRKMCFQTFGEQLFIIFNRYASPCAMSDPIFRFVTTHVGYRGIRSIQVREGGSFKLPCGVCQYDEFRYIGSNCVHRISFSYHHRTSMRNRFRQCYFEVSYRRRFYYLTESRNIATQESNSGTVRFFC